MIASPLGDPSVVMDDEAAVPGAAHVELDSVGAHGHCQRERVDRVLGRGARCAAMGDDVGHRPILCTTARLPAVRSAHVSITAPQE